MQVALLFFILFAPSFTCGVELGIDVILQPENLPKIQGRRLAVFTNHAAINKDLLTTLDALKQKIPKENIVAIFAPEHGYFGRAYADETIEHSKNLDGVPIYSLYGKIRRPTLSMFKNVELLLIDIQDIGSRSYTYISTLFYLMEEAAKAEVPIMVLDRPNPINGVTVDGPLLNPDLRSIVGYINVPYCHGMTIGELTRLFNEDYQVHCKLEVIPMKGWNRTMSFADTGLPWIPTSPHIPEKDTPLYYPVTGILGELGLVNIGVGYTLPFKLIGAPWIEAIKFAEELNKQKFPGVHFRPFYYRPFYGKYQNQNCEGVLIVITDPKIYRPVATQFLLIGMLKNLYPHKFNQAINSTIKRHKMFNQVLGTTAILKIMNERPPIIWKMIQVDEEERAAFLKKRESYLIPEYSAKTST